MALSGFLSPIGQSSLHEALVFLYCLCLQAANGETRASIGQVSLDFKDDVSVPLSDSSIGILKPSPQSQRLRQSVALGDEGREVWAE